MGVEHIAAQARLAHPLQQAQVDQFLDAAAQPAVRTRGKRRIGRDPSTCRSRCTAALARYSSQARVAGRLPKGGGQGEDVLRLGRQGSMKRRQDAGDVDFFVAGVAADGERRQVRARRRPARMKAHQPGRRSAPPPWRAGRPRVPPSPAPAPPHVLRESLSSPTALARSSVVSETIWAWRRVSRVGTGKRVVSATTPGIGADASSSSNRPSSGCTKRPSHAPVSCWTTSVPSSTTAQRSLPQSRQQPIDAEAGDDLRRPLQTFRVGEPLAQTKVAILAAVEAPEEQAVEVPRGPRDFAASAARSRSCPARPARPAPPRWARAPPSARSSSASSAARPKNCSGCEVQ